MKLFIGHYLGGPEDWFLVWAKSKVDAIRFIDSMVDEPDIRSFLEIDSEGYIELSPNEDSINEVTLEIIWDLVRGAEDNCTTYIERDKDPDMSSWIGKCVTKPFGPPDEVEVSEVAEQMGIKQSKLFRMYFPESVRKICPICHSKEYAKGKKCPRCGLLEHAD